MTKTERQFDIYEGAYAYAADYHSGQWSRAYALIGKLLNKGFRPGLCVREHGRAALTDEGKAFYDALVARNY